MFKKKEYLTIFIILVTEVLGFSLILPFLPIYVEKLGGTPLTVGLILMTFSLLQFFSAPVMGKLSDTYGRKNLLILSQISTFLSFVLLGFSKTIPMLFLSRAVDGLLGSNATIAQSYLSDISTKKDRSKAYGLSGAAFGFGFLIGPAIGGSLAKISFALPAFIAALLSLISIFLTATLLKETVDISNAPKFNIKTLAKDFNILKTLKVHKEGKTKFMLGIFFVYIFSHVLYVSNMALFTTRKFGVSVEKIGYLLTYVGLISIILRAQLLGKLIDKLGEKRLITTGFILTIFSFAFFALFDSYFELFIATTFFAVSSGLLRPTILGEISRTVSDKKQGEIMGITGSLGSIAQISAPIIGGAALTYLPVYILPLIGCLTITMGFYIYLKTAYATSL